MTDSLKEEPTRQAVLDLIVEKGPVTATVLAKVLDLTTAAVRRHIGALEDAGLIVEYDGSKPGKRGRGRPARYYVATRSGHDTLPEDYSELASRALSFIEQTSGEQSLYK